MDYLKKAIDEMRHEIDKHDISDYVRHNLIIALEQIKDAAMRIDCPDNQW